MENPVSAPMDRDALHPLFMPFRRKAYFVAISPAKGYKPQFAALRALTEDGEMPIFFI